MNNYNLGFISNKEIFDHVKETVSKFRFGINLDTFKKNLLDPVKFTFDSRVYQRRIEAVIEDETFRQIDKSNTNHIGYFHQNIFSRIGNGWTVPAKGYDVINESKCIYVEMKNKHNTMNSSSSQKTYMRMQNTLVKNPKAVCYLVEVIATASQNIAWKMRLDGDQVSHENIRRLSIDKFYEMVTGNRMAFKNLCEQLPKIIDDVIASMHFDKNLNTVTQELQQESDNLLKSIYLISFKKYEGFEDFNI